MLTKNLPPSGRAVSNTRMLLEAIRDVIYSDIYKTLRRMTNAHIGAAIEAHEDFLFTRPGFGENMVLTGIAAGGDRDSVTMEFTDVAFRLEDWKYAMGDLLEGELLTLQETLLTVLNK